LGIERDDRQDIGDQGSYLEVVRIADPAGSERREIDVDLPAGADPLLQPARRCRHVAFLSTGAPAAHGIGVVPALGVVALAETQRLHQAPIEAVQRTGRRADARRQIAASWFEQVELKPLPSDVVFHSVQALRRLQEQRREPMPGTLAEAMDPDRRAASGKAEAPVLLAGLLSSDGRGLRRLDPAIAAEPHEMPYEEPAIVAPYCPDVS